MYQSIVNKNITFSICAMWGGEVNIYDPKTQSIELGISVINRSKEEDFYIDQMILTVRKNIFLSFLNVQLPVNDCNQVLPKNSEFHLKYDLKPILERYGDQKKIYFSIITRKKKIESKPISIKVIHNRITAIYARHF